MNRGCTLFAPLASHYEGIEAGLALLNEGRAAGGISHIGCITKTSV